MWKSETGMVASLPWICTIRPRCISNRKTLRILVIQLKCSFVSVLILLASLVPPCQTGVFNSDSRYLLWPNPSRIPFQIQANHISSPDFAVLSAAMNQITSDTAGCIVFRPYDAVIDRGSDFVLFRNRLTAGIIDICYTFPGLVLNNGFGQVAVIFGSSSWPGNANATGNLGQAALPAACLDNQRDTMRVLLNTLGVRNEHNRQDRNTYLTFQSLDPNTLVAPSLQRYNLFNPYNSSIATIASTFDYNSVTLVTGTQYAASPNSPVFVPAGSNQVGLLPRLSRTDCLVLNLLYRCNAPCPDPYATTGGIIFGSPTTFAKHVECPPQVPTQALNQPLVIGDIAITNGPGVTFSYTLTPQVSYLSVTSTTKQVAFQTVPAARILLTQVPNKGFVNGQFTLTATAVSGSMQGSTTITITINCTPQFVSSTGGRPAYIQPAPIAQPSTFLTVRDVYTVTIGTVTTPGMYVNCRDPDVVNNFAGYLPSTLGFVTATDPEGGRISYYIVAPFDDVTTGRGYRVTLDGVIAYADNNDRTVAPVGPSFSTFPYGSPQTTEENVFIGAVDPAGGLSVIHYKVFTQCGPPV